MYEATANQSKTVQEDGLFKKLLKLLAILRLHGFSNTSDPSEELFSLKNYHRTWLSGLTLLRSSLSGALPCNNTSPPVVN